MKTILLTNSDLVAFVDDLDYEWLSLYRWHLFKGRKQNYAARSYFNDGKWSHRKMHQDILRTKGRRLVADHINGDGLDNRRENLRLASPSQNARNQRAKGKFLKGVSYHKGRYVARICCEGKSIALGSFDSEVEAASAYNKAATSLFKEFALINFMAETR